MNSNVETLYVEYMQEKNTFKKERILGKIFKCYEPLSNKLSYKYSRIFPSYETDDWKILVNLGIWEGVNKTPNKELVRKYIYFRIKHQIAKEIQLITARKQTYFHEVELDSVIICPENSEETRKITKLDIEAAIDKLPDKTKQIIKLWMDDVPVCPDSAKSSLMKSSICDEVNLSFPAVYFRLERAFELLYCYLSDYKESIYEEW